MLSGTFIVVFTTLHLHHHAAVSVGDSITAAVAQSPLFGSSELGQPFDDGTTTVTPPVARLQSLSIAYGPFVFGFQATYLLENGGKFSGDIHGMIDPDLAEMNSTVLHFRNDERIQRITGTLEQTYGFITMLKLYTNNSKGSFKVYGPFGDTGICDFPFTLSGSITGIFGRSGKYLNAFGAYVNALVTTTYNHTKMIGGIFGLVFDDYPVLSAGQAEMLNITINSGAYIFGLAITY